jgi:hypothetical protein
MKLREASMGCVPSPSFALERKRNQRQTEIFYDANATAAKSDAASFFA